MHRILQGRTPRHESAGACVAAQLADAQPFTVMESQNQIGGADQHRRAAGLRNDIRPLGVEP
jgi:hypothetical protein